MYLWTSEFVSKGHPDKVADQIADAVLDVYLEGDPQSRVACEVTITKDFVLVTGEVHSQCRPDIEQIVKATLRRIGYDSQEAGFNVNQCEILNKLHEQSPEIGAAVAKDGAGDQGMMFGFASAETHCHMPLAIYLAREIIRVLEADREANPETPLLPDAKSQVTLALRDDGTLDHVQTVLVSTCHRSRYSVEQIQDYVKALILDKMLPQLPEREVADAFGGRSTSSIRQGHGAWAARPRIPDSADARSWLTTTEPTVRLAEAPSAARTPRRWTAAQPTLPATSPRTWWQPGWASGLKSR